MTTNTKRRGAARSAPPILEQRIHPDSNQFYDAFEAQIEAAKHVERACKFIVGEGTAVRQRSGSGHEVITQNEIEALKSAFLAAAHIAYGLRRRLDRGALVEDGHFCLGRDRFYQHAHDFFQDDPALWVDFSARADSAGILVLEHVSDLGYDPASADWWPIMRGSDDDAADITGGSIHGDSEVNRREPKK